MSEILHDKYNVMSSDRKGLYKTYSFYSIKKKLLQVSQNRLA